MVDIINQQKDNCKEKLEEEQSNNSACAENVKNVSIAIWLINIENNYRFVDLQEITLHYNGNTCHPDVKYSQLM